MRDESDRGSLRPLVTAFLGEADPGTGGQPVEIGIHQAVSMKIKRTAVTRYNAPKVLRQGVENVIQR